MDIGAELLLVAGLLVLVVLAVGLALLARGRRRTQRLRDRFGPEYGRAVDEHGGRRSAEQALDRRLERRRQLDVRPLEPQRREQYAATWQQVQAAFVDQPGGAVVDADLLVRRVMQERGYPVDAEGLDLVAVDHPDVAQEYRAADRLARAHSAGQAGTEDLRQAMVHYRALFARLLQSQHPD